jgi:8-oxo-dGTP pyrophosphatase MutT (NUDIX family)
MPVIHRVDRRTKLDSDRLMTTETSPADDLDPSTIKQVGALPVERTADGHWRVILITTRDSGRWSIPKGNPIKDLGPAEAAAQEAFEEGGLSGPIDDKPIGSYVFWKRRSGHWELARVEVFLMDVRKQASDYKEKGLRKIERFSFEDAEEAIMEPGLKSLIVAAKAKLHGSKA